MSGPRTCPSDWYPGVIPENVVADETSYLATSYSFVRYRSRAQIGLRIGRGASLCVGSILDVGIDGRVAIGDYALVNSAKIICDAEVVIGDYALIAWDVVVMDTYRVPFDVEARRRGLVGGSLESPQTAPPKPVVIGRNVWIGFGACVLPGVRIGEGSVVGACSVVNEDVPPFVVVAGNPARIVRSLARRRDGSVSRSGSAPPRIPP